MRGPPEIFIFSNILSPKKSLSFFNHTNVVGWHKGFRESLKDLNSNMLLTHKHGACSHPNFSHSFFEERFTFFFKAKRKITLVFNNNSRVYSITKKQSKRIKKHHSCLYIKLFTKNIKTIHLNELGLSCQVWIIKANVGWEPLTSCKIRKNKG